MSIPLSSSGSRKVCIDTEGKGSWTFSEIEGHRKCPYGPQPLQGGKSGSKDRTRAIWDKVFSIFAK